MSEFLKRLGKCIVVLIAYVVGPLAFCLLLVGIDTIQWVRIAVLVIVGIVVGPVVLVAIYELFKWLFVEPFKKKGGDSSLN